MMQKIAFWRYKAKFIWLFFVRLQLIVCVTFLLALFYWFASMMQYGGEELQHMIRFLMRFYPLCCIPAAILYHEMMRKEEYYFYYNAGCTRYQLWTFSLLIASIISFILYKLIIVWI